MIKKLIIFALLLTILLPFESVRGQNEDYPVYVIRSGDTINSIALRFDISVADILAVNQLDNPDILAVGTPLKIPGYEGITGEIIPKVVALGENITRLSRATRLSTDTILRFNRITSPNELYAGSTLILPADAEKNALSETRPLESGQSSLEYAVANDTNPWVVASTNQIDSPSYLIPGEPVFSTNVEAGTRSWSSPLITDIQVTPLPLVQGATILVRVKSTEEVIVSGELAGMPLQFHPDGEDEYVALQGIHALAEPGLADFDLMVTAPEMETFSMAQPLLLESGYYPNEIALVVDPATLDPAVTKPEDELIRSITSLSDPTKYWTGMFQMPVGEPACIKSWYGNRRSYNGSAYTYFHTGVDYGVCANLNIYAPAAGVVVYTGALTVRGNATIIDHGWGVYSGIWHQKTINVNVGDKVEKGQLIGEIGGTGRATGPHLHWEVWVNGIQVQPLDWLENTYP